MKRDFLTSSVAQPGRLGISGVVFTMKICAHISCDCRIVSGLYMYEPFLKPDEAQAAYQAINTDFPWDLKPRLYGEPLKQHAYHYKRYKEKVAAEIRDQYAGLAHLELLCLRIEQEFDGKVDDVWCNRFQKQSHGIGWHHDTYGRHILVLSLGASRPVQFRNDRTGEVTTIEPSSGDLYLFPLRVNDTHLHRVCSGTGTRLSLVFYFKPPKYAKEWKITRIDKFKGKMSAIIERLGP